MRKRLVVLLLIASAALGQTGDPNQKRGFSPDKVYQIGDIDSVNVQNGNLIVRIPIGKAYSVGPVLTYQLVLTANGKLWNYEFGEWRYSVTEDYSNAGFGWLLGLGRLIPPGALPGWRYLAPDGAEHEFKSPLGNDGDDEGTPTYAFNNSYLRMRKLVNGDREIDFPDSTIKRFNSNGDLEEIRDRFGNWIKIDVVSDNTRWTITEGYASTTSRKHVVHFLIELANRYDRPNFRKRVDKVEFEVPDSGTGIIYDLTYTDDALVGRGGGGERNGHPSRCVTVPLLSTVTLPDSEASTYTATYKMPGELESCVYSGGGTDEEVLSPDSGALTSLTLPTKGRIEWVHDVYRMNMPSCSARERDGAVLGGFAATYTGVTSRTLKDRDGTTVLEQWNYRPALIHSSQPVITGNCGGLQRVTYPYPAEEFINVIKSPSGLWTKHFFSAYPREASDTTSANGFLSDEQGLPFSRRKINGQVPARPVSTEAYECAGGCSTDSNSHPTTAPSRRMSASYARQSLYAEGAVPTIPREEFFPYQMTGQRTETELGTTCADGPCYTDVAYSNFDHYGHFETVLTTSNFPESQDLTTNTNYAPLDTPTKWFLDLYEDSWVKQGTAAAKKIAEFDPTTGAMKSLRTLAATGSEPDDFQASDNDLLTVWCRDSSTGGARGFVTSERRVGGTVAIPSEDVCSASDPRVGKHYYLNHQYVFDTKQRLTNHNAKYDGLSTLSVVDEDFDVQTGLVKATRDSAGLETTFKYDVLGRIEQVKPPEQAWTLYKYDRSADPPTVSVQLWGLGETDVSDPENDSLKDDYYYYDGLGRLTLTKARMPSADTTNRWSAVVTQYDDAGRVASVSMPVERTTSSDETLAPSLWMTYSYDVFGSPTKVTASDNTYQSTVYTGTRIRTQSRTDTSTRQRSVEEYDGRGRLVKIKEYSGNTSETVPQGSEIITTYGYDLADRLTSVSMAGTPTQARSFDYDNRGWLKTETHPEKGSGGNGTVTYADHDAAGRPWKRTEGSGPITTFAYDAAERLTDVKDGAGTTIKHFDFAPANSTVGGQTDHANGRLRTAIRYNDLNAGNVRVTETFTYTGTGGRPSKRETKVERESSPNTFATINTFTHSLTHESDFGLPATIGYPTCNASGCSTASGLTSVTQSFDRGLIETIDTFATLSYNATGMISQVKRSTPTSSIDQYTSDAGMVRPGTITFGGLVSCTLASQPQIQSATNVCPTSTGNSASIVSPSGGVTYSWTIVGGAITSSANGDAITFTAGASGSVTLTATASNACGNVASQPRIISITSSPAQPQIQSAASLCPTSSGNTASIVSPPGGLTYAWTITGGTITSGTTGTSITFNANASGSVVVTAQATNACGGNASSQRTIPLEGPTATLSGSTEIDRGGTATLNIGLTGTAPWSLTWSDGFVQGPIHTSTATRPVSPLTTATYTLTSVSDQMCTTGFTSGYADVIVYPAPPVSINAYSTNTSVSVTWPASPDATQYLVQRATSLSGTFVSVATTAAPFVTDTVPASSTRKTYVYRVRSIDEIGTPSRATGAPRDFATTATLLFAETVSVGLDIKGSHVDELRKAVDALRLASNVSTQFGSSPPLAGAAIAAADFTSLVNALNGARSAWLLPNFLWTGVPPPSPVGEALAAHVNQLREAVR